ncbi:MAG: hypothetical protein IAI49_10320, partial [Candidatus Eremiobacteraeota bacterium]|nr:hypothetical protein [Candidatus Eremiobacteraeota bacterium]
MAAFTGTLEPAVAAIRLVEHGTAAGASRAGSIDTRVGVSLVDLASPATGPVFTDAMKQAPPWSSTSPLHLDADGNVLSLGPGQIATTTIFAAAAYPAGDYTLLFDGTGTIEVAGAPTLARASGAESLRIVPRSGGLVLRLRATAANDPIRNVRLILPGYLATYATQP